MMLGPFLLNDAYCGDNVNLMAQLPDECIDLTVTSPPYDDQRNYNGYRFDFEATAKQLYRVTKTGRTAIWVVGGPTLDFCETLTPFKQAIFFVEIAGFKLLDTMIYHRQFPTWNESRKCYRQDFEYIFVLSKGNPTVFNPIRDIPTRWKKPRSVTLRTPDNTLKKEWCTPNEITARGNIWFYQTGYMHSTKDKSAYEHPAIFPDALARDLILSWSNPNDLVFDPFCGSGTTLKMAQETGRNFLGFDISAEYVELSKRRIQGAKIPFPQLTGVL